MSIHSHNNSSLVLEIKSLTIEVRMYEFNIFVCVATTLQVLWNSAASTVAGFTLAGGSSATQLSLPYSLAVDSSFTIYIADRTNNRIQKWLSGASTGTTVAGQASATSGTGLNYLNGPCDVILDSSGNMYISDTENHRVFYWVMGASSGTIVAGTGRRFY
jgi:hypothetical protein